MRQHHGYATRTIGLASTRGHAPQRTAQCADYPSPSGQSPTWSFRLHVAQPMGKQRRAPHLRPQYTQQIATRLPASRQQARPRRVKPRQRGTRPHATRSRAPRRRAKPSVYQHTPTRLTQIRGQPPTRPTILAPSTTLGQPLASHLAKTSSTRTSYTSGTTPRRVTDPSTTRCLTHNQRVCKGKKHSH